MNKLHYIGQDTDSYKCSNFDDFLQWFIPQRILAHDVETNVVPTIVERILITLQFSDGVDTWVIQWSYLTTEQKSKLISLLNESNRKYIIHSGTFEYTIWRKYGVYLKNIWDTYRVEQILNTGKAAEEGSYNLESVIFNRFGVTLNKEHQLSFGDDIMTDGKIEYGAGDVVLGPKLYEIQKSELKSFDKSFKQGSHKGLYKTAWWENEFTLVTGDLEYEGVLIDQDKWIECYNKTYPEMIKAKIKLDTIVVEEFKSFAIQQGWLSDKNRFESLWGSSQKKKELLSLIFSNIEDTTKVGLKEYLRDNDPDFPIIEDKNTKKGTGLDLGDIILSNVRKLKITGKEWEQHDYPYNMEDKYAVIKYLILLGKDNKDEIEPKLNEFFYHNFPEYMKEKEYVIPANTLSINWNSSQQKLTLFKYIKPSIESTDALTVESNLLTHELFRIYENYQEKAMLISKFGLDYLKHIQPDGKIRTVFNTVLATGRLSAKLPNLLQLPRNQDYRGCFVAPEGWKIVDADWDQQELCILATLAKEPLWLNAIKEKKDLHSMNGELVYKDAWKQASESDCMYVKEFRKCNCKEHKEMRTKVKNLGFGLAYGLSAYGFAARNHVTESEAQSLINEFFNMLPNIKNYLTRTSMFGVKNNFIYENGTGRVRWFDKWKTAKKQDYTGEWVYTNLEEASGVMRASANFTIQAFGASLLKVAAVLMRRWIYNNQMQDNIKFMLPYHDQLCLYAKDNVAELAKEKLEYYMKLAGKMLLKHDLLNATAKISDYWIKD